jgi:hypothetical protein
VFGDEGDRDLLAGRDVDVVLVRATSAEWKSIEWPMFTAIAFEPPLTNVI